MIFSMSSFWTMICCTEVVSLTTTANLSPVNAKRTSIPVGSRAHACCGSRARRAVARCYDVRDLGL